MRTERLSFFSQGIRIIGIADYPPDLEGDACCPAVLILHGYTSYKDEGFDELSRRLVEAGFITLRIDQRGCGESGNPRGHIICHSEWPEDAANGISYLETLPHVNSEAIGIVGQSLGASNALYIAALDRRIKCVVALSAIGDCEEWLRSLWLERRGEKAWERFLEELKADHLQRLIYGRSAFLPLPEVLPFADKAEVEEFLESRRLNPYLAQDVSLESIASLLAFKPLRLCPAITAPTLFIHGAADTLVPLAQPRRMYEAIQGPKRIEALEGVGHNMVMEDGREQVFALIIQWFRKHLFERCVSNTKEA